MLQYLQRVEQVSATEMLCIGDNEETDAGMANSFGAFCCLIGDQCDNDQIICLKDIGELLHNISGKRK